jgi:purine-binding chemotaxis protein CheW
MSAVLETGPSRGGLLLPPTQALLQGFVFDAPTQPAAPRAVTARPAAAATLLRQGFRIGQLRLAIRYEDGSELTDLPAVHALPRAPAWFLGMANLHGALVPVFDPALPFGVAHDGDARPMLLVLGHGEARAGVVIDGLPVRLRFTDADLIERSAVPPALAGCIAAAYWSEGLDWLDLQVDALLRQWTDELAAAA